MGIPSLALHNSLPFVRNPSVRGVVAHVARLIERLPRVLFSRGTQMILDAGLCGCALYFAYLLRFDFRIPTSTWPALTFWVVTMSVLRPLCLLSLGTYSRIWRYFNLDDTLALALVSFVPSCFLAIVRLWHLRNLGPDAVPLSIIIMELGLFVVLACSGRMLRRLTFTVSDFAHHEYLKILMVGSEQTLADAATRLRSCESIVVVGMLISGKALTGLRIAGFPVLGEPNQLNTILASRSVDMVLVTDTALPCLANLVETASEFGVDLKLLPAATNVIRGNARVTALAKAEVALRHERQDDSTNQLVVEAFRDRVVLITGAGGSIGSELTRQVCKLPIAKLLLLDQDENSIFERCNCLLNECPTLSVASVVGDIRDRLQLERLFSQSHPHIVLHAAAYKHVPVMEDNCCEAVLNNVIGTKHVAEAALEFGAERFVMVSTDKAVRPSSVMGATKRVAELIVQAKAAAHGDLTRWACVRFGNVLGSRGSVVPTFLRQIREGGPITITDESMTRYFMTIPDAVRLILQAATLASRGEIYMLDMGDPVKIMSVARMLIEASGLRPGIDIEIKCVGVRPGEKLSEQLWSDHARVQPTYFPHLFRALEEAPIAGLAGYLDELTQAATSRDEYAVLSVLQRMPIEFRTTQCDVAVA